LEAKDLNTLGAFSAWWEILWVEVHSQKSKILEVKSNG
jgi:hypothetical protein